MESEFDLMKRYIREHVIVRKQKGLRIASFELGRRDLSLIFDFRAVLLNPAFLDAYATLFWERYSSREPIQVCGLETAGIPLVAAIVMKGKALGKSVNGLYMRKERKLIGLQKVLEGTPNKNPLVIVDDLINSGNSIEKQLKVLADEGLCAPHVFTIIRCNEPDAYPFIKEHGATLDSLFAMDEFDVEPFRRKRDMPSLRALWRIRGEKPQMEFAFPKSAPVLFENLVIFGSDKGTMQAFKQENGTLVWKFDIGFHGGRKGIWSTPAVAENVLYFGGYDGNLYALEARTGRCRWIYRDADWIGSSPALAEDLGIVFIGLEFGLFGKQGGIAALDMETGTERWVARDMPLHTHASPLYIKERGMVVIGSNDGILRCFDAMSGALRWTFAAEGAIKASATYDARHDLVIFGSFDGNLYALHGKDGALAWRYGTESIIFSDPLIENDTVYLAAHDKRLHALDVMTGKRRWRFVTFGKICASPVCALGSLWIGSNDGGLREIDPKNGSLRSYFQATERIVNKVAINEETGKIFLPTQANELYCLEKMPTPDITKSN